jgi:hypothetical protein
VPSYEFDLRSRCEALPILTCFKRCTTPTPNPSPQGGGELASPPRHGIISLPLAGMSLPLAPARSPPPCGEGSGVGSVL